MRQAPVREVLFAERDAPGVLRRRRGNRRDRLLTGAILNGLRLSGRE
ncbi:MAG TPA: hypothetical protein VKG91_18035 [Roseiarcus sp.]|nr:hypothetical protein [Roseiarcus sp.]